ncbi:DsrE family protein [Sphingomonas sp. 28-63-12]|uniref:DsrE family protein n=1 Tax=Sphingomonas sp. 28-63-12 TaxID=1970434 RepID=UPI000BCA2431|nr:MAG: hypothetical protein B7Y47_07015 [Sphingomonas sp. 28-63-12]
MKSNRFGRFWIVASLVLVLGLGLALAISPVRAATFAAGPVFREFGKVAAVDADMPVPPDTMFKVAFDISDPAKAGEMSRAIDSAARFINMNAAAGVPPANIHVALVVHGRAGFDLTRQPFYAAHNAGLANGSEALVAALLAHGVDIYLCGQSAAGLGIGKGDMLPGVKMALSAMTAHALLQQRGYTLNPF